MVSDQEPRYRLVDDNGNIVGSLYGKPDGSVAIQETDSGADREVALAPDGTFSAPSVETESVSTEQLNSAEFADPNGKSIQDAINDAGQGGHVIVLDGIYQENGIRPLSGQTVEGWGEVVIDGGSSTVMSTTADGIRIKNLKAETGANRCFVVSSGNCSLVNCWGLSSDIEAVRFAADAFDSSMIGGASDGGISISGSATNIETSGVISL